MIPPLSPPPVPMAAMLATQQALTPQTEPRGIGRAPRALRSAAAVCGFTRVEPLNPWRAERL